MKNGYYLECGNRESNGLIYNEEKIMFDNDAAGMYAKLEELTSKKTYDHITVRYYNGWLRGLIGEWFNTDKKVFWYDTYPEFQQFKRELGNMFK